MLNGLFAISEAQVRLGESLSTTAAQQAMLYPYHVQRTADEIARKTWSLYLTATTDLVLDQASYTIPHRPFRLGSVCVNDGNGNIFPLAGITYEQADDRFYNWRNTNTPQTYQGVPQFYVDDGAKNYTLLPVPNYSQQFGLLINGYYGVDRWWDMSDDCPLPEGMWEALVCGVCYRRAMELLKTDKTYGDVLKMYREEYQQLSRRLYREALGMNEARRSAIPSLGKRCGVWQGVGYYGGGV